jgi:hypothetical protein
MVLLLLIVVYPLSIGPVAVIATRYRIRGHVANAVGRIYTPLIYGSEAVGADKALRAYMMMWFKITSTPTPG